MTENELKVKALMIGRQLERLNWYDMSAAQADKWCQDKARERGATDPEAQAIALMALHYVMAG